MQGVCSQIMGIRPSLLVLAKNATMPDGTRLRYPPTFFVQMARDVAMADWIALDADKLKSQASILPPLAVSYVRCKSVICMDFDSMRT